LVIAVGKSRKSLQWKNTELDWGELTKRLHEPKRTAETVAEYDKMGKDARGEAKDVGGFVGGKLEGERRVSGSVKERWLITLDADNAPQNMWSNITCLHDYRMACYSTHSHTPEKPRLRLVIPLARPVTPDEFVPLSRKVADEIGLDAMDPTTFELERLMYWPSVCSDGEYEYHEQDGPLLDPDEVLRSYGPNDAWKDATLWPRANGESKEVAIRTTTKLQDPTTKGGLIGLFCKAYSIPEVIDVYLSDVYEEGSTERYTYIPGTTSNGAVVYEDGKFLYSNHGSDPAGGRNCNAFDLVRIHLFGNQDEGFQENGDETLPSFKAMMKLASEDDLVNEMLLEEMEEDFGPIVTAENVEGGIAISDKDLAKAFAHYVKGEVIYSPALGFLVWDGHRFAEDNAAARIRIIQFIEELQQRIAAICFASQNEPKSNGVDS